MNPYAQALGRLAAGKPKNYSKAERERRRKRLAEARKKRWPTKESRELYECDACGKTEMRTAGTRQWCECNPSAPFQMHSVVNRKVVDRVMAGLVKKEKGEE